jgi:hypothetical protein
MKKGVMSKNVRVRLFIIVFLMLFLIGGVFAIYAFPGATGSNTVLVAQSCGTETASTNPESFGGACTTTNLNTNNAVTQTAATASPNNNQYLGFRIQSFNSSVSNCGGITNVKVCYEWWSSSASIGTCTVKVDANGGGSYSTASSTCPGTTANPGEICTDVTALENWTCYNFFTASGTRAVAYLQVQSASGTSKTLTADSLYFNVTYVVDAVSPIVTIIYPANTTYTSSVVYLNSTVSDTNLQACWYSLDGGKNTTFSCNTNVTGLNVGSGSHTWRVFANDSYGNNGTASVVFNVNLAPTISNITISPDPSGVSATLNITANGVNDSELGTLQFFCSETTIPTNNLMCSSGNISNLESLYSPYCTYTPNRVAGDYTVYCRMYDGISYSSEVNKTYQVIGSSLVTSVISVAGDLSSAYFDTNNDDKADILVSGSTGMSCKWFTTDLGYSGAGTACNVTGTVANCSVSTTTEGAYSRYVSCQDVYGNAQTSIDNLNIDFVLDYTAPTTSDDADTVSIHVPTYEVTIAESDNVDSDPTSYYCYSTSVGCSPTTSIDNGGIISFSSSNRGPIYLRYYSTDDALNSQTIVNRTININRLPTFTSATDNAVTILGGTTVTVSTVSSDLDSGQNMQLFVCGSSGATSSGCTGTQYCSALGTSNLSCGFASETDTATHTWYAYLFDTGGEASSVNPLTGFYSTDYSAPIITVALPENASSSTQSSTTASISLNEQASWVAYSLDGNTNVTMTNVSLLQYTAVITGLSVGDHNVTFYANDSYGNMGESSTVYFSRVNAADTTAPTLLILSPSNASYSSANGVYVNVSSDEALVWAGYKLNGGNLTDLTNASFAVWYVNLTSLNQESTNAIIVYGNDSSGNQGNRAVVFYVDSLSPRYSSISAPSVNQGQDVNCSIVWNDGFALNSVLIGENSSGSFENHTIALTSNGTASYIIVGSKLANAGSYGCQFYATDVAGNTNSTSTTFSVNDVTAPTVTVTSPGNFTYNQQSISISLVTNENSSSAWYSLNGATNVSMTNSTRTSWSATLSSLANGQYNIKFYANDTSGNVGNSSLIYFTINDVALETVPPVITITSIANASYKTLSGIALNITTNENVSWVRYSLNGSANVSMTNTSMFSWNATLIALNQESTNSLIVYANDTAGNIGLTSITFYADSLSPRFSSVSATSINETQNANCTAYVNDSFAFSSVKISENTSGSFVNHTIDLFTAGYANYTILNVAKGNYSCVFYATDVAGNTNSTSTTFSVNDINAPTISVLSPGNNSDYSMSSIPFILKISENVVLANYSLDSGANVSLSGSGDSWSSSVSVVDGAHSIVFYAIDSSTNVGVSDMVYFNVDTETGAPSIVIWSPVGGIYYSSASQLLNITSDASLRDAGYSVNGSAIVAMGNTSLTSWNATYSFASGLNTVVFYANQTSLNNNRGTASSSFYIDLDNPSVDSFVCNSPANDSVDINCLINVSDSIGLDYMIVSDNSTGTFVNSSAYDLSGTSGSLNYNIDSDNTNPGSLQIVVYVFDLSGRVKGSSFSDVVVLDDWAPIINNISYYPSSLDGLDPGVDVVINSSITEDYSINNVSVYYKNGTSAWSSKQMTNTTSLDYNVTINLGAGNWTFYLNATDSQGNQNVSQNYSLSVFEDTSSVIADYIEDTTSFILSERSVQNLLGVINLNNTGDSSSVFNVSTGYIDSALGGRFNINYSNEISQSYTIANGSSENITLLVNTTGLSEDNYLYNINISSPIETLVYQKTLRIQTSDGPYLILEIVTSPDAVTRGESGVSFVARVRNAGAGPSSTAQGVWVNWTLPSGFTLVSGDLNRYFSTINKGESSAATNSITISVANSTYDSNLTIDVAVSSDNANSSSVSKTVSINDPLVVTQTVTTSGGSSSTASGGGGGSVNVSYSKKVDLVRGIENSFEIFVCGKYPNKTLRNLKLELTGFPSQYVEISPSEIYSVGYEENKSFRVTLKAPSYKSYEEFALKAKISGVLVQGESRTAYSEIQNIKLVIQEISAEKTRETLEQAENAITLMSESGFNFEKLNELLNLANSKLMDGKNKEAYDLAKEILSTKELAFAVNEKINRLKLSLVDPSESGNVVIDGTITGKAVFASNAIQNLLDMAISAFERGDYSLADERIRNVETLLALERKGNIFLFTYLYWPYMILVLIILASAVVIGYRFYQKRSVGERIEDADKEEERIKQLISNTQQKYFSGKLSVGVYHSTMKLYTDNLSKLRESRLRLRSRRVKILSGDQIVRDLDREKGQTEKEIMKVQGEFYKDKKIGEGEYKTQFDILNERLAEIEEERLTTNLMSKKAVKEVSAVKLQETKDVRNLKTSSGSSFGFGNFFKNRKEREEKELKDKIDKLLRKKGVKI